MDCLHRNCWFGEFQCGNGQCVRKGFLCDGVSDCFDGSDEVRCQDTEENFVKCADGSSVHWRFWCDGWPDCPDNHADEIRCSNCTSKQYTCSNSRCISEANVCDGVCDCAVSCEDEYHCSHHYAIISGVAVCESVVTIFCQGTDRCIQQRFLCDGNNDCHNGYPSSDEYGCTDVSLSKETFQCPDGRKIPKASQCDHKRDCLDGLDEFGCEFGSCRADELRCGSGDCVSLSTRCDAHFDCMDRSDELHCSDFMCPEGKRKCSSGQCVDEDRWCDFRQDCPDGSDEDHCGTDRIRGCDPDEYRCGNGQCIPRQYLCYLTNDQKTSCADNTHLINCGNWTCPPHLYKCRNGYCIHSSLRCDGRIDCKDTWTDEDGCPFQCSSEARCLCQDVTINCILLGLHSLPTDIELEISRFIMTGNFLNHSLGPDMFRGMNRVSLLDLSNNSLAAIPPLTFGNLFRLRILYLQDNKITQIENGSFTGLGNVATLHLFSNSIASLEPFAFYGLSSLKSLDLSHQQLTNISQNAFQGLRSLRKLNLSYNKIVHLVDGTFNGLVHLLSLDLSHNRIQTMGNRVFHGLVPLDHLVTDEFHFCCLARHVAQCLPPADEFSSCEDLMSNLVLRVCVWVLGIVAFTGNCLVIVWRLVYRSNNRVHSFLITNLAIGDMVMGAYLLVIAVVDSRYRGVYFIYDRLWRSSGLCHFVGFLSTLSSELSVFTLTVITLDRFVCIIFPFRLKRLEMQRTRVVMTFIWLFVCLLAGLPLCHLEYFANFYGRSGVCLALHITNDKPNGWEYSVFVFLALNFVSFSVIAASYLWMYLVAKNTHKAVRSLEAKRDSKMARRMTLIVFTDFACWMPIIALGIVSLLGVEIPPQVFAWIAVFVLPLNAAVNPILYTLSTAPFLGPARSRMSTFRRSFMTSITGDTHPSLVSNATVDDHCQGSPPSESCTLRTHICNTELSENCKKGKAMNFKTHWKPIATDEDDMIGMDELNMSLPRAPGRRNIHRSRSVSNHVTTDNYHSLYN